MPDPHAYDSDPEEPLSYALRYLRKRSPGATPERLPSTWSAYDKHPSLVVLPGGVAEVDIPTFKRDQMRYRYPIMIVKANRPVDNAVDFYYFEVQFLQLSADHRAWCGIGLAHPQTSLEGTGGHQFNYLGDGRFYYRGNAESYGPRVGSDDTVGCGFRRSDSTIFFTRNGELLGSATRRILASELYPQACLAGTSTQVKVNFGQFPFAFNVEGYCAPYHFSRVSGAASMMPNELIYEILNIILGSDDPHHLAYILGFYRSRQRTLRTLAMVCRFWGRTFRPSILHTITICDRNDVAIYTQLLKQTPIWYCLPNRLQSYIHVLWIRSRHNETATATRTDVNRIGRSSFLVVASALPHLLDPLDRLYIYGIDDEGLFYKDPFQCFPPKFPEIVRAAFTSTSLKRLHTLRFHAHRFRSFLAFLRIITAIHNLEVLEVAQIQFEEPLTSTSPIIPGWLRFSADLHQLDVKDCQHSFSLLWIFLTRSETTAGGGARRKIDLGRNLKPQVVEIARILSHIMAGNGDDDIDYVFDLDMLGNPSEHLFAISFPADGCRTTSPLSSPRIQILLSDVAGGMIEVIAPWNGVWAPDVDVEAELASLDQILDQILDLIALSQVFIQFVALDAAAAEVDPIWKSIASTMPQCSRRGALEIINSQEGPNR